MTQILKKYMVPLTNDKQDSLFNRLRAEDFKTNG